MELYHNPFEDRKEEHEVRNDFNKHIEPGCPYRKDDVMDAEKGGVQTGTTIL